MLARYLEEEQKHLRSKVLEMGDKTGAAIGNAIQCYSDFDQKLADGIINNDAAINEMEHQIEAECINIIARQQPVAHDLRELLSDMNIAKELERIGDYAVSIAKIVRKIPASEQYLQAEILEIGDKCSAMLTEVMLDYAEQDAQKANICALKDDEIDEMEQQLNLKIFKDMKEKPGKAIYSTYKLSIAHHLERIGDRVTNIAEEVIFLSTGKVVNF